MKKSLILLITFFVIILNTSAQSAGDYRSVASGNWNDATKWEIFDGTGWVSTTTYPGQNSGTGAVTIMIFYEIKLTATVPFPIGSLVIDQLTYYSAEGNPIKNNGALTFSSVNPVSLAVSGRVAIWGELIIEDVSGARTHTLSVGGVFEVGVGLYEECNLEGIPATFQTINHDDKLKVVFNGYNSIFSGSIGGIEFQDITFSGVGFDAFTPIFIKGNATFINGIVRPIFASGQHEGDCRPYYYYNGSINFYDGATASGASNASFVDGGVWKWGDDPFIFPIGNDGVYSPLQISGPVGEDECLQAGYVRSSGSALGTISDAGLYSISNCEYWVLNRQNGNVINYPLEITVGWTSASGCGPLPYISNVPEVTLAHFSGTNWDNHGGSGIGTATNGSVTWSGVTTLGVLTLGNLGPACGTPSGLTVSNLSANSATVSWSDVPGSISYDVDYKAGPYAWRNAATAITSTSVNLSGLYPSFNYAWRVRANCSLTSSAYIQSQFTTPAACDAPTGLSATNITFASATLSWNSVTNSSSYKVEFKQSSSTAWQTADNGITSTSYTLNGLIANTAYDWRVRANCSAGGSGNFEQASFTTTDPVCNDIYETNNTSSQAKTISIGNTISAGISSPNDVDWFKVTTPNNSNTNLEVSLGSLPADYDLYVYNKSLKLVGSSVNAGTANEVVIYNSNARKATYYIKVVGKNGAYNTSLCYNLLAQVSSGASSASSKSYPVNEVTDILEKELLYPNPASEFVHLNFATEGDGLLKVQILNNVGQLIKHYSFNVTNGYNNIRIPVGEISLGMYILKASKGELNLQRKFVIAR